MGAMGCRGDSVCRAEVDAALEQSVCLCGWTVNWNANGNGYGMSWSSANTPDTCGGPAETAGSGSGAETEPAPESESESEPEPESESEEATNDTAAANSGEIACTDAPALDWTGIDARANGEAGVSEECRNRNFQ